MRFYEVKVEMNTLAEENETATQQNLDRQNISRKTDAFLEEYEERAYIFVVGAEKRLELAVCVKDELLDVKAIVEAFLAHLEMTVGEICLKEISLSNFLSGLRLSGRGRFISDDDSYAERIGVEFIFFGRPDYYKDKLVDEQKTEEDLKADAEKYHLGDNYKVELERILARKVQKVFRGNPANYLMISKDDSARRMMARDLVTALYSKGRLQSKRYTIINVGIEIARWKHLKTFIKSTKARRCF